MKTATIHQNTINDKRTNQYDQEIIDNIDKMGTECVVSETISALNTMATMFDYLSMDGNRFLDVIQHKDICGLAAIHRALACRLDQANPWGK
ncbi:MAG: hypothetical protein KKC76_03905 [Proteobacteria bacterium]|nr:hypothetical protein [Pseudomonadota bacterium]MBU4294456.1 hypothetical protein [Pseudomonadota bacterium]MCG2749163.1 hypothetical protein [Desulfobulbaceae bacterium]